MTSLTNSSFCIFLDAADAEVEQCDNHDHTYDREIDDEDSIIQDACSLLARSSIRFVVSGFSDEPWPVDVETDLAIVLQQLPATIAALRQGNEATLDFYEQGIERALVMRGQGAIVEIECATRHPTWVPTLARVSVEREALLSMFVRLGADFYELLENACGELAAHPWLLEWRRKVSRERGGDPDRG